MHDQLCDIISDGAWSCSVGEIRVNNKIVTESEKREKKGIKANFFMNVHLKECMDWKS